MYLRYKKNPEAFLKSIQENENIGTKAKQESKYQEWRKSYLIVSKALYCKLFLSLYHLLFISKLASNLCILFSCHATSPKAHYCIRLSSFHYHIEPSKLTSMTRARFPGSSYCNYIISKCSFILTTKNDLKVVCT